MPTSNDLSPAQPERPAQPEHPAYLEHPAAPEHPAYPNQPAAGLKRVLPLSDRAILVEYANQDAVLAHYAGLRQAQLAGVLELVPAARTLMLRFDPTLISARQLAARVRATAAAEQTTAEAREVVIDVSYTGDDLDEVAGILGISTQELVRRHSETPWRGAFAGFAPGFVYFISDDPLFQVPRRTSPRTRIPAGALALADNFSGIYPRESPGGWQLIGRTAARMWDLTRTPPALVQPGQTVRFRPTREHLDFAHAVSPTPLLPQVAEDARALEVLRPGAQLLLQDLGRAGLLAVGVTESGAADRRALRAANRCVGNDPATAALELAGGGARLRARCHGVVAYTGASGERSILTADGSELPLERGVPTAIDPGDTVRIGAFDRGLRGYLAVRGGFAVPPVLGSLATDTISGTGPAPLRAGDVLTLGDDAAIHAVAPNDEVRPELPAVDDVVQLDVTLGPRTDWFTQDAVATLTSQLWEVTAQSNRVGLRLAGEVPLARATAGELPSEAVARGAIQVPVSGQPVLFLADHPTTGGYPVIGAVVDADLDAAGQLAPGMRVQFRVIAPFDEL